MPHSAAVGQKIALDGTVSTYSLLYTRSNAYVGGVIDAAGDIHFVPHHAGNTPIGQKISASTGLPATYAIPYIGLNACSGGILGTCGCIWMIPYGTSPTPVNAAYRMGDVCGVKYSRGTLLSGLFNKGE